MALEIRAYDDPVFRLVALIGATAISFSAIFVRLADVSPSTAAFFRPAYALPILIVLWWLTRGEEARSLRARAFAVGGGLLTGVSFTLWNYAIEMIGAGLSTVLGNTQVVFVAILAWWLYGERPSRLAMFAVPLVFAGVVFTSGLGRADAYGQDPILGTVLSLANALVYTSFLLIFRSLTRGLRLPTGPQLDATAGAVVATLVGGLLTDPGFSLVPTWPAHGWLALLGLGSQVIGWLCIMAALPRLPALDTSVILLMQPVLTVVWALLIFGEFLSVVQWSGVALVLVGIAALSLGSSLKPAPGDVAAPGPVPSDAGDG